MHIERLHIANMKLLDDFSVDFMRSDGDPRPWTVFVGENGKCKTTILQAIALAASGPEKSNQIAGNLPSLLTDKRRKGGIPSVSATFARQSFDRSGKASRTLETIVSRVTTQGSFFEQPIAYQSPHVVADIFARTASNRISKIRSQNEPGWLCAGYGVGRNIPVPLSVETRSDNSGDRLRSLFDPRYQLVGTDFVARFEPDIALHYSRLLREALVKHHVLPDIETIDLRGRGGVTSPSALIETHRFDQVVGSVTLRLPAIALSHGYQSTVAWIADFIGQAMLDAGDAALEVELATLQGIVLIDEIDLHLHPRWQRGLIRTLKAAFPRVQFVATTHSPLVLSGLDRDEIFVLQSDALGSVTAKPSEDDPRLMTASGILQAFFGVDRVDPDDAGGKLREYGFLASTADRTDDEQARLDVLLKELHDLGVEPDWEPVPRASLGAEGEAES